MSQLSDFSELTLAAWLLGKATPATAATRYVGLFTGTVDDAGNGIEVTGGAYTRQDITSAFPAATAGTNTSNADVNFSAATTNWGTVTDYAVLDSNVIRSFTNANINTGTDQITITGHSIATATPARVSKTIGDTFPTGLTEGSQVYVRSVDANTVSLHPTAADATANTNKIDITAAGTGTFYLGCGNVLYYGKLLDNTLTSNESETVNSGSTFKIPSTKSQLTLA